MRNLLDTSGPDFSESRQGLVKSSCLFDCFFKILAFLKSKRLRNTDANRASSGLVKSRLVKCKRQGYLSSNICESNSEKWQVPKRDEL